MSEAAIYVFEAIDGLWRVTQTGVGGTAPKYRTLAEAKAEALKKARKSGLPIKILS